MMYDASKLLLAVAVALATAAPMPVLASPATDAFTESCLQNPDFFSFAVDDLGQKPEAHPALCTCLVSAFADNPEADIVMLTRDMDGSATDEIRTAYGDYTALESLALSALTVCVAEAGLSVERPEQAEGADMTKFDASCQSSQGLLEIIGGTPEAAIPHRTTLCACLSAELAPLVTTVDADVLGMDLDETATAESRAAHPGYDTLTQTAGTAFDQCFRALELPADS